MGYLLGLLVAQLAFCTPWTSEKPYFELNPEFDEILSSWRLPTNEVGEKATIPLNYTIDLWSHGLKEQDKNEGGYFELSGSETIYVSCNKNTRYTVLHTSASEGSFVNSVKVDGLVSRVWKQYRPKEYLIIYNDMEQWAIGSVHKIEITWEALLRHGTTGLYVSSYYEDGQEHYMAATQLESTGARKMFPCFDEPGYKSTFGFTIMYKYIDYAAVGNMPASESGPVDDMEDYFYTTFDRTMTVSPYLIALIISDYKFTEDVFTDEGTLVRVGGPKNVIDSGLGDYALEKAKRILQGMSDYYGYDYSKSFGPNGAKSDQVGIDKFSAGAMENWGLVTYQTYLTYIFPETSYQSSVLSTASVIGHELQHQWTGNLVTCDWWDNLWINEAFADLGGYLGLRWAEPTWNWRSEFYVDEFTVATRADHSITSRPIINKQNNWDFTVTTPSDIGRQFDLITYQKGGSILLMCIHAMTEKRWQYGMQKYLNAEKFTNTNGEIYFSYMQKAIDDLEPEDKKWQLPFSGPNAYNETFDAWFRQMGYPVVNVWQSGDKIMLTQSRYLHSGTEEATKLPESSFDYWWNIPISYLDKDNNYKLVWMLAKGNGGANGTPLEIVGTLGKDIWIDPESQTFMRVKYGPADNSAYSQFKQLIDGTLERSAEGLPENFHSSIARTIMDQWELMTSQLDYGIPNYIFVMEATRLLTRSDFAHEAAHWPIWYSINYVFDRSTVTESGSVTSTYSATKLMLFSGYSDLFTNYMGSLAAPAIHKFFPDFEDGGSHESKRNARYIVKWACDVFDQKCLDAATQNFRKVRDGALQWDDLNINYRDFSLNYGIRNGNSEDIKFITDTILRIPENDVSTMKTYLKALSYMKQDFAEEAFKIFDFYAADGKQELFKYVLREFGRQPSMRNTVFDYMTNVAPGLVYEVLDDKTSEVISTLCSYISNEDDFQMVNELQKALSDENELGDSTESEFAYCNQKLNLNKKWMSSFGESIIYWIRTNGR